MKRPLKVKDALAIAGIVVLLSILLEVFINIGTKEPIGTVILKAEVYDMLHIPPDYTNGYVVVNNLTKDTVDIITDDEYEVNDLVIISNYLTNER